MSNTTYHVIIIHVLKEAGEIATAHLYDAGSLGLEEVDLGSSLELRSYFDGKEDYSKIEKNLLEKISEAKIISHTMIDLKSIEASIPSFDPIEIDEGLWISPPKDMNPQNLPAEARILWLRPGMGFGTGRHETTQLVARFMKQYAAGKTSLLDVGSGSGILSLIAHELKIPEITAVEIDEHARVNSLENFELNSVSTIELLDNITSVKKQYDVIVANIISSTLIYLKKYFKQFLKENGTLILSGILTTEKEEILSAFSDWDHKEYRALNEWSAFVFKNVR